ncbi:MAG: hypothetical protein IJV82_01320 [Oscillospiraceae bacterium]|nr:hypothetical protein [Oscillospiraceae bacterium]
MKIIYQFADVLSIASYVLLALGLYTMAKRRGIRKPWLAWIPLVNLWLVGCLSDQFQYVALGQQKNRRKTLLILELVCFVLALVLAVVLVIFLVGLIGLIVPDFSVEILEELLQFSETELVQWLKARLNQVSEINTYFRNSIWQLSIMALVGLLLSGLGIWLAVVQYMAYYDLFRSTDPKNAGMYLTLSIVLSFFGLGILLAVFVYINREKDLGMPPRGDAVVPPPPVWTPPTPPIDPYG